MSAAVSGLTAIRIMHWTTSVIQVNSGIRPSVIPLVRWVRIVVAMFTAPAMLPNPTMMRPMTQ